MPLDRTQFELMYEDRDRPVSPYSQIAAIRLRERLGRLQALPREAERFGPPERALTRHLRDHGLLIPFDIDYPFWLLEEAHRNVHAMPTGTPRTPASW